MNLEGFLAGCSRLAYNFSRERAGFDMWKVIGGVR
jgi:hypothetical protein